MIECGIGWRCAARVDGRFPPVVRDVVDWELIDGKYEPVPLLYEGERFVRLPDGRIRIYSTLEGY